VAVVKAQSTPEVVASHGLSFTFFAVLDAPEEINDEWNLGEPHRPGCP
jgi:hypothetical protein